ncbi:MAG: hypothetical protein Q9224_006457, partial [Gallowayella concinna]
TQSVASKRVPTTLFSLTTKRAIELDGLDCWHCGSRDALEHAHMIGRARSNILARLQASGKTTLEHLHQKENGVYLCVRCHRALDDHEDLGWVFIPSNLDYFLEAESIDYARRMAVFRATGSLPKRTPPTPNAYVESCGGLYDAYMLRHWGEPNSIWQRGRSTHLPYSKAWHGDPMLAIYKGLKGLPACFLLLPDKLLQLGKLYEDHDHAPLPNGDDDEDGQSDKDDRPDKDDQGIANKATGHPTPERSTKAPGRGNWEGRASGISQKNVSVIQEAPGQHQGAGIGSARTRQKRQLEEPPEAPKTTKRIKVEVSPWKWGPGISSNHQVDDLKRYRAHMRAHGFPVGSDRETTKKGKAAKQKTAKVPTPDTDDTTEERVLGGIGSEGVREWLSNTS